MQLNTGTPVAQRQYIVDALNDPFGLSVDHIVLTQIHQTAFAAVERRAPLRASLFNAHATQWQNSIQAHNTSRASTSRLNQIWCLFEVRPARRDVCGVIVTGAFVSHPDATTLINHNGEQVLPPRRLPNTPWRRVHIEVLAVLPQHEGRGGGSALVEAVLAQARRVANAERQPVLVTVDVDTELHWRAERFYRHNLQFRRWHHTSIAGVEHRALYRLLEPDLTLPAPLPSVPVLTATDPLPVVRRRITLETT